MNAIGNTSGATDSGGPVDPALIEDLVAANRILAGHGVLDAYGHVSMRHPAHAGRYLMSRSLAPELVCAADILEYDLDSQPVDPRAPRGFLERFIHGEIYKARPEVNAVVHSHSPSVIPFGVSSVALQPIYHMSSFLHSGVPVFEIRAAGGMTDMLVRNPELGAALARSLGERPVALMRGHGNVVVATSVPLVVFRAIYTETNARLQMHAIGLGGSVTYLAPEEGRKSEVTNAGTVERPWELWKKSALRS
ncbi:MAG: class II aldolase/adducin family protein [Betaproteobacteria bacterium]|nr:class II aldolase/adducin family protein [Betaproteobacteria bacterium]